MEHEPTGCVPLLWAGICAVLNYFRGQIESVNAWVLDAARVWVDRS